MKLEVNLSSEQYKHVCEQSRNRGKSVAEVLRYLVQQDLINHRIRSGQASKK